MHEKGLLLTYVFGPYGIEDNYAVGFGALTQKNEISLTFEQGIHAVQFSQPCYNLHLLAQNVTCPVTVLEYPTWKTFCREVRSGKYAHVGITFVQASVWKASHMAHYIRAHCPGVHILLGGYGTMIPDVETIVPCDAVCRGEGIRWLRDYLGEPVDAPIQVPLMNYYRELRVYGVNIAKRRNMIQFVTGVGCKGGCDFCAITAKYGNTRFVPFIQSGEEFLRLCEEGERRFNAVSFSIMDDNFPKNFPMIRDLLPLMEARGKTYRFFMFASADSLVKLGVDFLVRFGAETILMGVESMSHIYAKVKGIDVPALIADLRDNGIGITTSSILFMEHHTKDVLRQEIDWIMSLDTETHFIGVFTPYLGTCAYEDYVARGLIPATPDHRLFTGIDLAINHPHFTREEADAIQRATYVRKYREGGPAALARASTVIRGYRRARNGFREREREGQCWNPETLRYEKTENPRPDTYMKLRLEEMRNRARMTRPVLWTCWLYAPSPAVRAKARETMALYREEFGRISLKDTILSLGILTLATVESIKMKLKVWLGKDYGLLQPKPGRYTYPAGKRS